MLAANMSEQKTDVPYGTLDLLILKTSGHDGPDARLPHRQKN